jgi:hypothetical protein
MKTVRLALAGIVLASLVGSQAVQADGWSLANMFSTTTTKTEPAPKKPNPKYSKQPPSALEKVGTGTKNFFSGIGDTLTGKKTAPKKPVNSYSSLVRKPSKPAQKTSSSWNPFHREEPKPPQSLKDFMGMQRLDP